MADTPKTLHQQAVDYAVQRIAQLSAELAARDLLIMDLRAQLEQLNPSTSVSPSKETPVKASSKKSSKR